MTRVLKTRKFLLFVVLLVVALAVEPFAQSPLFIARKEFRTGDGLFVGPVAVTTGRFRGPGFPLDIAVANSFSDDVAIFFGNGRGDFSRAGNVLGLSYPFHLIAKDFRNNGILDLAVANLGSNNVAVLQGNGNGTFQGPQNYPVASFVATVAAGDFDNDGYLDLAAADIGPIQLPECTGGNLVSVLLGNQDGTFRPAGHFEVQTAPEGIDVEDFNNDENIDIATANLCSFSMSVLFGDGAGNFPPPRMDLSVHERPSTVVVADFNNDGLPDLATINEMSPSTVSVLLKDGMGGFLPRMDCGIPGGVRIAAGDFNLDGNVDLAVSGALYNKVFILLGTGTGSFFGCPIGTTTPPAFDSGPLGAHIAVGDFNGDGLPDLAVANKEKVEPSPPQAIGNLAVLTGDGYGNFGLFLGLDTTPIYVAAADLDRDGKQDLVIANVDASNVRVFLGDGLGGFTSRGPFAVQSRPVAVTIADFNNDQKPDLAVANFGSNSVSVLLGNGDGTFQTAIHTAVGAQSPNALVAGDFDCDGKQDLAIVNTASNNVRILYGNGNGTFTRARTLTAGGMLEPISIIKGNFGSGRSDLAVINRSSNNVSVFLADGCSASSGFVARPNLPLAPGANPSAINSGDFNRDGKMDLAVANNGLNTVSVFFGNGDGTFRVPINLAAGVNPSSITVADYNGDGITDLAVASIGSNNVFVFLGRADGSFLPAAGSPYFAGLGPVSIATGNFDNLTGSTTPDLVMVNLSTNAVSILLNMGP